MIFEICPLFICVPGSTNCELLYPLKVCVTGWVVFILGPLAPPPPPVQSSPILTELSGSSLRGGFAPLPPLTTNPLPQAPLLNQNGISITTIRFIEYLPYRVFRKECANRQTHTHTSSSLKFEKLIIWKFIWWYGDAKSGVSHLFAAKHVCWLLFSKNRSREFSSQVCTYIITRY